MRTAPTSLLIFFIAAIAGCDQEYSITSKPVDLDPGDVTSCDFTPVPGTRLRRYDCNPVFAGAGEDWGNNSLGSVSFHATEVLGHPFYQMWYVARPGAGGANYGIGYAISAEGEVWDTHPANPLFNQQPGFAADGFDAMQVVWNPIERIYAMTYQGFNLSQANFAFGIGAYTSPDGVNWTAFNNGNPIIDLTQPQQGADVCWPLGMSYLPGTGYTGFLAGSPNGETCQIFRYTGTQLNTLQFEARQLITLDDYDNQGVTSAAIVELNDVQYLFYVGFTSWTSDPNANVRYATNARLSLATSTDGGQTWVKDPNNPFPINNPRLGGSSPNVIGAVAAQVIGQRIHLWVTDFYPELDRSAVGYFLYEPSIELHP